MRINRKSKKDTPSQIWVSDSFDESNYKFPVIRGYHGVLFEGHFCLSVADAQKVAQYINDKYPKTKSESK